ncbi:MAG: ATP-binding protein [Lachnospiraceae bacterium]|nr:ATP-binding protein [Lachnospiraceae bacterium]
MSLTNEQYDSIMREYDAIRNRNARATTEKQKMIYNKFPELKAWENRAVTLKVQKVKQIMEGAPQSSIDNLEDEATMLLVNRMSLLESNGLSPEDLEPIYDCKDCHDTGYIYDSYGNREKCHCFREREINILYNQSGIRQLLKRENFSKLTYKYHEGEDLNRLKGAVDVCRDFVDNFDKEYKNLVLNGTVGTGKSFLSCCIASELLESYHSVIYLSAISLFEILAKKQFSGDYSDKGEETENLYECDLLIIDDLGTELSNSFVASSLFGLINERDLRRKSTIISTNLGLPEIRERYADRVLSRLTGNYIFLKLTGKDLRTLVK